MQSARFLVAALLAASAVASGELPAEFPPHFWGHSTGLAAFAGMVVEGGGQSVARAETLEGVLQVDAVLPTFRTPEQPPLRTGSQKVMFRALAIHDPKVTTFETPPNGSRVIGFGVPDAPPDGLLLVYADHLYADTPALRAVFEVNTQPFTRNPWQGRFFYALMIFAGCALVGAWIHLEMGAVLLAASFLSWAGYESTLSPHANIRLDLMVILPIVALACVSVLLAWLVSSRKSREAGGAVNPPCA